MCFTCRDEERATAVKDPLAKGVCKETCELPESTQQSQKGHTETQPQTPTAAVQFTQGK